LHLTLDTYFGHALMTEVIAPDATDLIGFSRRFPQSPYCSDMVSKIRRRVLVALIVVDLVAVGIVLALSSRTI
jgi:hypothetical protein